MPTSVISGTILDPSTTPVVGATVRVRIVPRGATRISDSTEIATLETAVTNGSGVWSLTLEEQSNISPTNSYYAVEEVLADGSNLYAIQVPAANSDVSACKVQYVNPSSPSLGIVGATGPAGPTGPSGAYTPFTDYSETNTQVAAGISPGTLLHTRTLFGLAAGTYMITAMVYNDQGVAGKWYVRCPSPTKLDPVAGQALSGTFPSHHANRTVTASFPYTHAVTGNLTIDIWGIAESGSCNYGIGTDERFGRKLLVTRVG